MAGTSLKMKPKWSMTEPAAGPRGKFDHLERPVLHELAADHGNPEGLLRLHISYAQMNLRQRYTRVVRSNQLRPRRDGENQSESNTQKPAIHSDLLYQGCVRLQKR